MSAITPPAERGSRAALAGVVFAVLFLIGWLLLRRAPSLDDSNEVMLDYYTDPDQRRGSVIAGLYIVPFAAIAFIWFTAALRDRYVRSSAREHTLLSTVHLIAGALFVASLLTVAAARLAAVWVADTADPGTLDVNSIRALVALAVATSEIIALRAAAVFIAVSSTRAVRAGLFPRWYGLVSIAIALALLIVFKSAPATALLMPVWVVVTSGVVLSSRRTHDLQTGA